MSRVAAEVCSTDPAPEDGSLEEAFVRWQDELLGTLFYLVGNHEDAKDALQESFVKCWRYRDQLGEIKNLKAWIFRVTLNTGRDVRQTAWRRKRQALPDGDVMTDTRHDGPLEIAAAHEELGMVEQALASLRNEEQEVFLLRQNGGLTYEEIGAALDLPTGTVKTRMRMALTKLRQALNPQ